LDSGNSHVVLDDDDYRTRWLYVTATPSGRANYDTLTYRVNYDVYYPTAMEMVDDSGEDSEDGENGGDGQVISFTVSSSSSEGLRIVLFRSKLEVAESAAESPADGQMVEITTPAPGDGLDSTPPPTATPYDQPIVIPVTTPPSVVTPTPAPYNPEPTEIPIVNPTPEPVNPGPDNPQPVNPDSPTNVEPVDVSSATNA
ncbi:MAG: hypothetical protein IKD79_07405, partial [Oscillospiraceae bacterium]|nr:hypothetical protein [Oscillospiraceae bacterium]